MHTIKDLEGFIERGFYIHPVKNDKHPFIKGWPERSSNDLQTLKTWNGQFKTQSDFAGWGVNAGLSDLVILDCDTKKGASPEDFELPETLTVRTPSGGYHFYFKAPTDFTVKTNTDKPSQGWDIRAGGGQAVLWGSQIGGKKYTLDKDVPIADLPPEILDRLSPTPVKRAGPVSPYDTAKVVQALGQLKTSRCENYDEWTHVGMALSEMQQDGLGLWDFWSQKSSKYERGRCADKWVTFKPGEGYTLKHLFDWAAEDSGGTFIIPCPSPYSIADYEYALKALGYEFSLNEMNDHIYINGYMGGQKKMSDVLEASIRVNLKRHGYKASNAYINDLWLELALQNSFHPIKEYLGELEWDGEDHIGKLSTYFKDEYGLFPMLIRKWLVGAVRRILSSEDTEQNMMLVLDGDQNLGKSYFVAWLARPFPDLLITSPINPSDKDFSLRKISKFIWEVEEVGSTFRRSDREALKAFITRPKETVRPPYGHHDIEKRGTASFIGTLNNETGFLTDPTGNRRFRITRLNEIRWEYKDEVKVNQVWAQAVALYQKGETQELSKSELVKVEEAARDYEVEDTIAVYIYDLFSVDPKQTEQFTSTAEIQKQLQVTGAPVNGPDVEISKRIGRVLLKAKCKQVQRQVGGYRARGWLGVLPKSSTYYPLEDKKGGAE